MLSRRIERGQKDIALADAHQVGTAEIEGEFEVAGNNDVAARIEHHRRDAIKTGRAIAMAPQVSRRGRVRNARRSEKEETGKDKPQGKTVRITHGSTPGGWITKLKPRGGPSGDRHRGKTMSKP